VKDIPLSGKVGAGRSVMVDDADYEWLRHYSFNLVDGRRRTKNPRNYHYVVAVYKIDDSWTTTSIHQLIMGKAPSGYKIDHKDLDTLNNQRSNLRFITNAQSNQNQSSVGLSRFHGVAWDQNRQLWRTGFRVPSPTGGQGKRYYLGRFDDEVEAAHNYDYYVWSLYGGEAALNFPDFDYSQFRPKRRIDDLISEEQRYEQSI
jgi:hypothetical protein